MNGLGTALIDSGIAIGALGLVSLVRNRRQATMLMGLGGLLGLAGAVLPAPSRRAIGAPVLLDIFVPVYEFREFHETRVNAPAERIYEAILGVTAGEIRLFQTLTWLRSPKLPWGQPQSESILNAPAKVDGSLIVAIPTADVILLTGSTSTSGLSHVKTSLATLQKKNAKILTTELFIYKDGRLSVWAPEPGQG